jgi:hypothetical protein
MKGVGRERTSGFATASPSTETMKYSPWFLGETIKPRYCLGSGAAQATEPTFHTYASARRHMAWPPYGKDYALNVIARPIVGSHR